MIAVQTRRVCNHGLEIKMSEPVPPVGLKSNGGMRPRYLIEYFAPSFKNKKKHLYFLNLSRCHSATVSSRNSVVDSALERA